MGGWSVPVAASALWVGILLAGRRQWGPGLAGPVVLLVMGAVGLAWLGRSVRRSVPAGRREIHRDPARAGPTRAGSTRGGAVALTVLSFGLLGAGLGALRDARVGGSPLVGLADRSVTVWAALGEDPEAGGLGWTAWAHVDLVSWSVEGRPVAVRVHERVWLEGAGPPPSMHAGDRIAAEGSLSVVTGEFGAYLRHRGFPVALSVRELRLRGPPGNPLVRLAGRLRGALRSSVLEVLPRREGALLLGLALGDTSEQGPEVEEDFRATGLSHLTAVSGENVAMFLAPVLGLAVLLGAGPRARLVVGLLATCFFVLLARAEPSVLRAALMAGLGMLGIFLGRPRSPPAILGGAVLVLLGLDPTLVYAIGFQLSVAATAGMMLLSGPLADRVRFLPRGLALAAATTLGAQAGVTPVLLYHFGVVPTVTIPANLLAFPAVGAGMLLGLVAAGVGLVIRPLGVLVGLVARVPLGYLLGLADRLARSPLPSVTSPGGDLIGLAAALAAVAAVGWWLRSSRKVPRPVAVLALALVPLFIWSSALKAGPPGSLTVTFFDVGQGDAALIRSPGGAAILIDGGPEPDEVARKLASLGVRRLDLMVATHPHADHVGGLPAVLARFPVALVADPGCSGESPFYADFLRAVRDAGVPFQHPRPGTSLRVGDVRLDVLGPDHCYTGTESDPNNDSLVLRVRQAGASLLFPGDAEEPAQEDLLEEGFSLLTAQVLKVPHHGGATSLDEFFLAVHARVAVVSVGPNRYGHPVPSLLATLVRDGMRVFRTDRSGDVTVVLEGGRVLIQS